MGGHTQARTLWADYFSSVDGIIFLVDAADPERLQEAQNELYSLLKNEHLTDVPFAILGNKTDKKGALPEAQLVQQLGVQHLLTGKTEKAVKTGRRPFEVFMVSVVKGFGYRTAFKWISQYM